MSGYHMLCMHSSSPEPVMAPKVPVTPGQHQKTVDHTRKISPKRKTAPHAIFFFNFEKSSAKAID